MALYGNLPYNNRILTDPNYIATASLSGSGQTGNASTASTVTTAFDFRQATPYPVTERIIFSVSSSLVTNTTGSKNINIVLQDSADNITFANVAGVANPLVMITNTGTTLSSSANIANILLPPNIREYVRIQATPETSSSLSGGPTGSITAVIYF